MEVWEYDLESFYEKHTGVEISAIAEDGNEVPATYFNEGNDCVVIQADKE